MSTDADTATERAVRVLVVPMTAARWYASRMASRPRERSLHGMLDWIRMPYNDFVM
ncbi:hypothetical protein ACRU13_08545 [Mycobacterium colombiense]